MKDLHRIYLVFFKYAILSPLYHSCSIISLSLCCILDLIFNSSPYLQSQSHSLGNSRLGEDGLDMRH